MKFYRAPIFTLTNFSFTLILFLSAVIPGISQASGLQIFDCGGSLRAKTTLDSGQLSNVSFNVADRAGNPLTDVSVNLKNMGGDGGTLIVKSVNGTASFESLPEGVWIVSSPATDTYFTSITVNKLHPPSFWSDLSDTAEVVLVAGGVIVAAVIIHNLTDGDGGRGSSVSDPSDSGNNACAACNPDLVAPSIPAF